MIENIKKNILKYRDYRIRKGRIKYWRTLFKKRNKILNRDGVKLSLEEIDEIKNYYGKFGLKPIPIFHEFYKIATGKFDVRNIPDDIYYTYIDPFFNNWKFARYLDNKTLYHLLFTGFSQPSLIAYRQNNFWLDCEHNIISENDVVKLIKDENICFLKQAVDSEGGKNIYVFEKNSTSEEIKKCFHSIKRDIVIQKGVKQSKILSKLNDSSVNTIRLLTFLRKDGSVKLCSSSLRMGINGAKVDNASSGGITVGIKDDGYLNSIAFAADGRSFKQHPSSGVVFSDIVIPNYSFIVNLVKKEAKKMPHFRLLSWDIALDEENLPILIEANLKYGKLEFHQLNNGPIFGEETEIILKEVFG